jgi:hypothetical protein
VRLSDASLEEIVYIDAFNGVKGFGKRLQVFKQITSVNNQQKDE